ncbi:DUF6508 domain-containing protein [Propioniciclava tarda]|uniref:DUF6508 domain-containing protein n=1 Tax=Propioniciclava tarda TaxID=433330 RepID=UPI001C8F43A0
MAERRNPAGRERPSSEWVHRTQLHGCRDGRPTAGGAGPDCLRLIATLTRKERFNEGTWIWAAESGLLQALLRRLLDLYA